MEYACASTGSTTSLVSDIFSIYKYLKCKILLQLEQKTLSSFASRTLCFSPDCSWECVHQKWVVFWQQPGIMWSQTRLLLHYCLILVFLQFRGLHYHSWVCRMRESFVTLCLCGYFYSLYSGHCANWSKTTYKCQVRKLIPPFMLSSHCDYFLFVCFEGMAKDLFHWLLTLFIFFGKQSVTGREKLAKPQSASQICFASTAAKKLLPCFPCCVAILEIEELVLFSLIRTSVLQI